MRKNTLESFWDRVDKSGGPHACWPWLKGRFPDGYGSFSFGGKSYGAHRLAWKLSFGEIPHDTHVCHHCDNPPCCNPAHLFVGTAIDNVDDMVAKRRQATGDRCGVRLHPESRPRGEHHHQAKLSAADVVDMRRAHASGVSIHELARRFGVAHTTAGHAIRGYTWRRVE